MIPHRTLAYAINLNRRNRDLSIRELGRRAGISAAQISRIEAGDVDKPSVETLVAVARELDFNPVPLMILAGHITGEEARERLDYFLARGSELSDDWATWGGPEDLERDRRIVKDPNSDPEELRRIAFDVATSLETEETLWHEALLAVQARGEGASEMRELSHLWPAISGSRRRRLVEFARDQVALSRAEFAAEMGHAKEAETGQQGQASNG